MKKLKKFLSFILIVTLTISFSTPTLASETTDSSITYEKAEEIFLENGYTENTFSTYSEEDAIEIAETLKTDPDSISIETTTETFDQIEELALIANTTEEELVDTYNVDEEAASELKEELEELENMSISEIVEEYDTTSAEARILKNVANGEDDYTSPKDISEENEVQLDAQIATSKLTFSQTVKEISTTSSKGRKYKIFISWKWKKCYLCCGYEDKVYIGWGGNLVYDSSSELRKRVSYFEYNQNYILGTRKWGPYYKTINAYWYDSDDNFSVFNFPTLSKGVVAKLGHISFTIKNAKKQNDCITIRSQYLHCTLDVLGSITMSTGGNSVKITGKYNVTDRKDTTVTVKD